MSWLGAPDFSVASFFFFFVFFFKKRPCHNKRRYLGLIGKIFEERLVSFPLAAERTLIFSHT